MNTIPNRLSLAILAAAGLAATDLAFADEQVASPTYKEKHYEGTVTAIDAPEHNLTIRGWLTTHRFNTGDSCRVTLEDKPQGAMTDIQVGQKVEVIYYDAQGVRVARRITQQNRRLEGRVTAIDADHRTLAVKRGTGTQRFTMTTEGEVRLNQNKAGSLSDLRLGDLVTVIYQSDAEPRTAQRIEQRNPTFTGTIRAIDARTRTVTAKNLLHEKTFHLASGCRIVVNGEDHGKLSDLRIGDRMSVTYEDADGVLVANRIGREAESSSGTGDQTAAVSSGLP